MIGQQISHFYIYAKLGSGGMGVVYEAQDLRLPRSVAIKVLRPELSTDLVALMRFKREARLASSLNHASICTVLDVDEGNGQPFIAMELLRGRSLKQRLTDGPLDLREILDIALPVTDALAAAHAHDIVHRDITPGNIFLTGGGQVKLLDFGLARHFPRLAEDGSVTMSEDVTGPLRLAGTVNYMAPEQFRGHDPVDHRVDLFALGAVLYEMATGRRPFEGATRDETVSLIRESVPIPIRRLVPQPSAALDQFERIVGSLLAKDPRARFQSAKDAWTELSALNDRFVWRHASDAVRRSATATEPTAIGVAVLPFEVLGQADAETQRLRDGLADEIGGALASLPDVRLAARTDVQLVRHQSVRAIGEQLGVEVVLEGSLQRDESRVCARANLTDVVTGRQLEPWVRENRQFDRVFDVQADLAEALVSRLAPALASVRSRQRTVSRTAEREAKYAYEKGKHAWRDRFAGGWEKAIEYFLEATDRNPRSASAWISLADAYGYTGFYSLLIPNIAFSKARKAAERALDLDRQRAAAHASLALILLGGYWDWDGAERAFRHALQIDPGLALARVHYAWLLVLLGRNDAAFVEARRALADCPDWPLLRGGVAHAYFHAREYERAIQEAATCLRADARDVMARYVRGMSYQQTSRVAEAVEDLEAAATLAERKPFYLGLLGKCYAHHGAEARAREIIAELDRWKAGGTYVPPQGYVYIYAGLGEKDRALAYQEQAYRDGAAPFNYFSPVIRDLYSLDRHQRNRLHQMRLKV